MPIKSKSPSWTHPETLTIAKTYAELLDAHAPRLEPRLPQGFVAEFRPLIPQFEAAVAGRPVRVSQQKSSTEALANAIKDALRDAAAIRNAVRQTTGDKAIHKLFGIGQDTKGKLVRDALSSWDVVIEAMESRPNDLQLFGITPADLTHAKASRQRIIDLDLAQEAQKGTKLGATASKDALHRQLISMCRRLLGAAELEFRAEPEVLARFRAPIPTRGKKKPVVVPVQPV